MHKKRFLKKDGKNEKTIKEKQKISSELTHHRVSLKTLNVSR